MNESLLQQIDQCIEAAKEDLTQDIIKLIGVKSVKEEPMPGAPFGLGPRAVLDTVLKMGEQEGFCTTDYNVGVVSLALEKGQPDLGIWLHGDVMPEGQGWNWTPYQATEYKDCVIGRGASDNKGQLCAIFHLLKIFKNLGIQLRYNPALYVGSDEECGMHDMQGVPGNEDAKGFCNVCTPPRLSLIPDSSFPIGYGGNGAMLMTFSAQKPFQGISILAGQNEDPGKAKATFYGKTIVTHSPIRHPSKPDPNGNMITKLMERLLEDDIVPTVQRPVLEFFKRLSLDIHGDSFGINVETKDLKPVTIFAQRIDMRGDIPELTISLRYPVEITAEEVIQKMGKEAELYGVSLSKIERQRKPYVLDLNWPVLQKLKEIAQDITKEDKEPYTISGGTYAHWLPNALIYGTDANVPPADFPADRGKVHGLDECVSLERLQRAMRIYARALLVLNDMEW